MSTLIQSTSEAEKSIFSSPSYLESSFAFCDLCFNLIDDTKEVYFQCEICYNFIACLACVKHSKHQLISHATDHLFYPNKPVSNTHWTNRHLSITCNLCDQMNFIGKRYQCCQCVDFNVCSTCLSKAADHSPDEHIFDFVPNLTKIHRNRCLLAQRTIEVLRHRNADLSDRDEITGWTIDEAEIVLQEEWNNYSAARKKASEIFKDEDIDFKPDIIENEKLIVPLVTVGNN